MSSQHKVLFKNTIIYALGTFGSKALAFLLIPLYTFYLSKAEFGTYDLFMAALSFLVPILTLQVSDSVYRWLIMKEGEASYTKVEVIISNSFIISIISTFIGLIPIIIYTTLNGVPYSYYFYVILLTSAFLPFFQSILRGLGKTKIFSLSGVLNTAIILVCNILFIIVFKFKIEGLFLATIIANVATIIIIIFKANIFKYINFKFYDLDLIKAFLKYSLPLVPNMLCWWLINISDKFIILMLLSVESNGIYAVATRFPSIIVLTNSIFLLAWQDHSIKSQNTNESMKFRSTLFNRFIKFQFSLIFFLCAITPFIFKYFISKDYSDSSKYIPFLYLGSIYSSFSAYVGIGYQIAKKTTGVFITTLIGGVLNVVISFALIKHIGLYAPAIGSFVSFSVIYIIRKYQTYSFYKIEVKGFNLIVLNIVALLIIYLVMISNYNVKFLIVLATLIAFIYINKDIVKLIRK